MNKDELKGKAEQWKGQAKQGVGDVTGDEEMKGEGAADETAGKVREGYGEAKRKTGDAVKDLGDAIKK
jgi:uncharacterized protein YjbJ (UPF0337 family)